MTTTYATDIAGFVSTFTAGDQFEILANSASFAGTHTITVTTTFPTLSYTDI